MVRVAVCIWTIVFIQDMVIGYGPKSRMDENDPSRQGMTGHFFHNLTKHQVIFCHPWIKCTPHKSFCGHLTPNNVSPFIELLSWNQTSVNLISL